MGHKHHWLPTLIFLLFSLASAIATFAPQQQAPSSGAVVKQHQREEKEKENGWVAEMVDEKRFGGPGSSPPSCRSKCGWCSPCQPVHVPVQPGLIIRLEYYPEAWRCKCGNKLYMP